MELNQLFLIQMRTSSKKIEQKFQIGQKVWLTRNHMSFLIDNFQFYLQVYKFQNDNKRDTFKN